MGLRRDKKSDAKVPPLPLPNLPLPVPAPLPPVGLPMPPLPTPNGVPTPTPLPVLPAAPLPTAQPVNDPAQTLSGITEAKGYNDLWAKRSEKPLQQIYGHIDRISNKEAGSLLDRYADRFGHSLDREIIVMRKAAVEEKVAELRDAPVVELLDTTPSVQGLSELEIVENQLRELKPLYQEAKNLGDKQALAEITPTLQSLMAKRKALKEGGEPHQVAAVVATPSGHANDALFSQFVAIVDDLLGEHLPEAIVNAFVASTDFAVYRLVLENPAAADLATRKAFYHMVDDQLGNMSSASIEMFVASPDFDVYKTIGEQYKGA